MVTCDCRFFGKTLWPLDGGESQIDEKALQKSSSDVLVQQRLLLVPDKRSAFCLAIAIIDEGVFDS